MLELTLKQEVSYRMTRAVLWKYRWIIICQEVVYYILTITVDLQTPANKLCAIKLLFIVERWDYIEIIHFVCMLVYL